jgi:SAM-dependent methyltransferase
MLPCACDGLEQCFDAQRATRELQQYRQRGAIASTQRLIALLQREALADMTLLDIGGGVGAIQHALLQAGMRNSLDVDASTAYLAAAREEADRLGLTERSQFLHGNFVELAPSIPVADVVTLDRVICCFADMPALVGLSAARATMWYGIVIPRDTWWMQGLQTIRNDMKRLTRAPLQFYLHPTQAIDGILREQGLRPHVSYSQGMWQVMLYRRRRRPS